MESSNGSRLGQGKDGKCQGMSCDSLLVLVLAGSHLSHPLPSARSQDPCPYATQCHHGRDPLGQWPRPSRHQELQGVRSKFSWAQLSCQEPRGLLKGFHNNIRTKNGTQKIQQATTTGSTYCNFAPVSMGFDPLLAIKKPLKTTRKPSKTLELLEESQFDMSSGRKMTWQCPEFPLKKTKALQNHNFQNIPVPSKGCLLVVFVYVLKNLQKTPLGGCWPNTKRRSS